MDDENEFELPQTTKQKPQIQNQTKKDEELNWVVDEVPTQTQPIIYNKKSKKIYTLYEALAELLNRTEE